MENNLLGFQKDTLGLKIMSVGGLLVLESIIVIVSVSALTWFITYIYYSNLEFITNVNIIGTKVLLPQVTIADYPIP